MEAIKGDRFLLQRVVEKIVAKLVDTIVVSATAQVASVFIKEKTGATLTEVLPILIYIAPVFEARLENILHNYCF